MGKPPKPLKLAIMELQVKELQKADVKACSSKVYGGTSAFFHMRAQAHFSKSRAQKYERNFTSTKFGQRYERERKTRNSICWEISWKLYAGKFLGNHMMEISWKLYAGSLLMETMCWEIQVDAGGFLKGVIMAQCYGIILRFQGNGTRGSVEHPGSADLSRTMRSEASEVYRKC